MSPFRTVLLVATLSFFIACDMEGDTIEESENLLFEDGFETQNNTIDELFPLNGSRWSTTQRSNPSNNVNEISITNVEFSEGQDALRILAYQSDTLLSKMDIEKNGLTINKGDKVTISADFYINGTGILSDLFLLDLECCSCWDPSVGNNYGAENQCPGVRLMMSGGNDFLSIERGKISGTTIQQSDMPFPRNQWVSVLWEMTLSEDESGQNKLLIDGMEVINESAMNLPNPQVFRDFFAGHGIDFTLQEPTYYERVQIGATANPTINDVELFVDNFSIKVE